MKISEKKINEELIRLICLVKFSDWTTPLNDTAEKKKFFKKYNNKEVYNPQYIYKKPKKLEIIKGELIELSRLIENKLYRELIKKTLLSIDFLLSMENGLDQVFVHGKPDHEMVALAKSLIPKEKGKVQKRIILAKEAKITFLENLKRYDLTDWKVKIKQKLVAKANVDASKKTLYISNRKYSHQEIDNLTSHEIEVHVLRAVNGYTQKNHIFVSGTSGYLKTEEGLAIMMEQLTGNYNPQRFKFFAARIIAADMAISKSFYEIFNVLHKRYNLSKYNSYLITKRVKRSLKDTSKSGGFIKDHVYFEGFQMIKKFMQGGGDIRPLFAGKIALNEIFLVKNHTIKPPMIIPRAVEAHYYYRSKQKVLF